MVQARLPDVDGTAEATLSVAEEEFDRLQVEPARIELAVGERRSIQISAVGPSGTRVLGDSKDLVLSIGGETPAAVEMGGPHELVGVSAGEAELSIRWRDTIEQTVPITVSDEPAAELTIKPAVATIAVDEHAEFQVLARRGGRLLAVSPESGLTLRVADSGVAELAGGLRVRGVSPGSTDVIAQVGPLQATARLTVRAGGPQAPTAKAIGLKFIPDIFRLQIGTPGDSIRVIRLMADGSHEDVDHEVQLTVRDPQDVINIERTASGPVVRPLKVGQTQVDAEWRGLQTRKPLLVEVVASMPQRARLQIVPNPLALRVGQTGSFSRAVIMPPEKQSRVEVEFKATGSSDGVVQVEGDNRFRGESPGVSRIVVTVVQPGGPFDGMKGTATIEVHGDESADDEANDEPPQLILRGPSEFIVGSEAQFSVDVVRAGRGRAVTTEDTTLVVMDDPAADAGAAEVRTGCRLLGLQAGKILMQARHKDLISNTLPVQIKPAADEYERLRIKMSPGPLLKGESRSYQVLGFPRGQQRPQDLTHLISDDQQDPTRPHVRFAVVEPGPGADVATHLPPTITGNVPGLGSLQAAIGDRLKSDAVDVRVIDDADEEPPIELRIEPQSITLRAGEQTPQLRVLARSRGSDDFRELNVPLQSSDVGILRPAGAGNRFVAVQHGTAQVEATHEGRTASATVTVAADRFQEIGKPSAEIRSQDFDIILDVKTDEANTELEYRIVNPAAGTESDWVQGQGVGNGTTVRLQSPPLPVAPPETIYRLIIECRDRNNVDDIERYPYFLKMGIMARDRGANPGTAAAQAPGTRVSTQSTGVRTRSTGVRTRPGGVRTRRTTGVRTRTILIPR